MYTNIHTCAICAFNTIHFYLMHTIITCMQWLMSVLQDPYRHNWRTIFFVLVWILRCFGDGVFILLPVEVAFIGVSCNAVTRQVQFRVNTKLKYFWVINLPPLSEFSPETWDDPIDKHFLSPILSNLILRSFSSLCKFSLSLSNFSTERCCTGVRVRREKDLNAAWKYVAWLSTVQIRNYGALAFRQFCAVVESKDCTTEPPLSAWALQHITWLSVALRPSTRS